jgi:Transposase DDE domain group 1
MLLLRQIDEGLGISRSLARCFYDARNPLFIEHSVRELVAQRLLGMAAGYEDLNDHNLLRLDPLFAVAVGKEDPLGSGRAPQDQGKALASASTLNRLELGNNKNSRCHKISADHEAIEDDLLRMGVRCLPKHSLEVVIDLDATDDPLHGHQEGKSGYLRLQSWITRCWTFSLRARSRDVMKGSSEPVIFSNRPVCILR